MLGFRGGQDDEGPACVGHIVLRSTGSVRMKEIPEPVRNVPGRGELAGQKAWWAGRTILQRTRGQQPAGTGLPAVETSKELRVAGGKCADDETTSGQGHLGALEPHEDKGAMCQRTPSRPEQGHDLLEGHRSSHRRGWMHRGDIPTQQPSSQAWPAQESGFGNLGHTSVPRSP